MSELWLIRHGETEWNLLRRVQGMLNIALNDQGREQARRLPAHFQVTPPGAHAIYSSDLDRAHHTAQPTAELLGLPIRLDAGLRERQYGVFQGLSFVELAQRHPDVAEAVRRRMPDFDMQGGESLRKFQERVVTTLDALARKHPGERVLVFTHSGVIDMAYRYAHGIPLEAERRRSMLNVSINRIAVADGRWTTSNWGDVSHLVEVAEDAV